MTRREWFIVIIVGIVCIALNWGWCSYCFWLRDQQVYVAPQPHQPCVGPHVPIGIADAEYIRTHKKGSKVSAKPVTDTYVTEKGDLILVYSDGSRQNAGCVKQPERPGVTGPQGPGKPKAIGPFFSTTTSTGAP